MGPEVYTCGIGLPLPVHLPGVQQQDFTPPPEGCEHMVGQSNRFVEALTASAAGSEVPVIEQMRGDFQF